MKKILGMALVLAFLALDGLANAGSQASNSRADKRAQSSAASINLFNTPKEPGKKIVSGQTDLTKIRQEIRNLEEKRVRLKTLVSMALSNQQFWERESAEHFAKDRAGLGLSAGLRAAEWAGKAAQYEGELQEVEARLSELRAMVIGR